MIVDGNVPTDQQGVQLRRLALDEKVDLVIGYISSANGLAVAPVAGELKLPTVLFDCGTNQVFEEARYKYVFRTAAHTGTDGIGAARYLLMVKPEVKTVAGLNQDYAWGRDSWEIFIPGPSQAQARCPGRGHPLAQAPAERVFRGNLQAFIPAARSGLHQLLGRRLRLFYQPGPGPGRFRPDDNPV